MSNAKQSLDLLAVKYDVYVNTAGKKVNTIIAVEDMPKTPKGFEKFRLKMEDQNNEVSFEEFDLSPYGLRKLKKFIEKTELLNEKEMKEFHHMKLCGKMYEVEYFSTKNKYYEPTNPNSKEYHLTIGNDTYKPHKKEK